MNNLYKKDIFQLGPKSLKKKKKKSLVPENKIVLFSVKNIK